MPNPSAVQHGAHDGRIEDGPGPDLALPAPSAPPAAPTCAVRIELGDEVSDEEVRADLDDDPFHRLRDFHPHLSTTTTGRTELGLTVPGPDVWSSALTAMAVLRRSGYGLLALHVESLALDDERPAA